MIKTHVLLYCIAEVQHIYDLGHNFDDIEEICEQWNAVKLGLSNKPRRRNEARARLEKVQERRKVGR